MQAHPTTVSESSLLRSPKASEGEGGALGEAEALRRGNTVGVRDQVMDLVAGQGLRVSRVADNGLLPTPTVFHLTMNDEPIDTFLEREQRSSTGQIGKSLGVALRMEMLPTPNTMDSLPARSPEKIAESKLRTPAGYSNLRESVVNDLLPTPKARDSQPEGYEAGLRRTSPQIGTWAQAVANGDERVVGELLPTPKALDGEKGNLKSSQERLDSGHQVDLPNVAVDLSRGDVELFPTPRASRGASTTETFDLLVEEEALLPTPLVDDSKNTGHNQTRIKTLASEVWETERTTNWGKFEPAIHRWEQTIGRPAPAPTKPDGKDGNHRLSSAFTEWMMGLPAGWITDAGLTRTEELKACGNGVVPQQAELALRILLDGVDL